MYSEKDKETEKYLQALLDNVLDFEDTFEFGCKQCGNCCRSREEPIILMGYDVYNMAQSLNLSPTDTLVKYTECVLGTDSNLPVVILKERLDGSCSLLRKGKCSIQEDKPMVCRIYPLGRFFDGKQFKYIRQNACKGDGTPVKVIDWLTSFKVLEQEEDALLWHDMLMSCVMYMQRLLKKNPKQVEAFQKSCLYVFYAGFDMSKTYKQHIEESKEYLEKEYKGFKIESV